MNFMCVNKTLYISNEFRLLCDFHILHNTLLWIFPVTLSSRTIGIEELLCPEEVDYRFGWSVKKV